MSGPSSSKHGDIGITENVDRSGRPYCCVNPCDNAGIIDKLIKLKISGYLSTQAIL
jgi:hypothetical protein